MGGICVPHRQSVHHVSVALTEEKMYLNNPFFVYTRLLQRKICLCTRETGGEEGPSTDPPTQEPGQWMVIPSVPVVRPTT